MKSLFLLFVLTPLLHAQNATLEKTKNLEQQVSSLVNPLIDNNLTPGLVVGIYNEGKMTVLSYGKVDPSKPGKPSGDTVYEIGSISKVFTGTLLADSIQRNKVSLSDPVQKFLPKEVTMPMFKQKHITLQHLTTHTSALPRLPVNFSPKDPYNPYADYTEELLYEGLDKTTLTKEPGSKYQYSNLAVGLLGHALTKANDSGSYQHLLEERILQPLKLNDTGVTLTDKMKQNLAPAFSVGNSTTASWDLNILAGAGGVKSTVNDLLTFASLNIRQTNQALQASHKSLFETSKHHIGMGWHRNKDSKVIWHNGATGGYRSYLLIDKKKKQALVVLANSNSGKINELSLQIFNALQGKEVTPLKIRSSIDLPENILQRYVGIYQLTPEITITVTLTNGQLFAQLTNQMPHPIFAKDETNFFYRIVSANVKFIVNKNNQVKSLILFQNGIQYAKKIK